MGQVMGAMRKNLRMETYKIHSGFYRKVPFEISPGVPLENHPDVCSRIPSGVSARVTPCFLQISPIIFLGFYEESLLIFFEEFLLVFFLEILQRLRTKDFKALKPRILLGFVYESIQDLFCHFFNISFNDSFGRFLGDANTNSFWNLNSFSVLSKLLLNSFEIVFISSSRISTGYLPRVP